MLPTFVIGLREGVEASLIVGIIAAFLRQRGALKHLRFVWLGVGLATALCLVAGVVLEIVNQQLPQRQQEQLETVIALVAVALVTSMIVWMAHHARALKGELEERAGVALAAGSGGALVLMAFLAVLREGFETAVFLVAAFQSAQNRAAAGGGALLGLLVAVGIGLGIYKGGIKIDLAKFFKATGLVLVLVAAGLVAFAMHTGHEAGWINVGQAQAVDLSWLIKPGSVISALLTGMLGIQPKPTLIEGVGWLVYFLPMTAYVLRPRKARPSRPLPTSSVPTAA
ncbi:MAG TPA: iron uptake transporter permease EfeU [Acidimicrobiales bacterium]|nr:iron uptake transporter permease EfeU [Acidimicrobiales bacterium]